MYQPSLDVRRDLENRFTYHRPNGDQPERYERIRAVAYAFSVELVTLCPPSRELSLALTKLDECVMAANASIARHEIPPHPSMEE